MSRVLLIDDDAQATAALSATLQVLGHEVAAAASAEEGRDQVERWHPDVALVDMMLPGTSGLEWIEWVALNHRRVYSCLATGMGDYRLLKQALAAGAWSLMCKPLALPDLMETLLKAERLMKASLGIDCIGVEASADTLRITSAECLDAGSAAASVSIFARHGGADLDTAARLIPITIYELLQNALHHGNGRFELECRASRDQLHCRVTDPGPGFAWQRELVRRRTNWEDSRASGLQLICAAASDLYFEADGRTACVQVPMQSQRSKTSAAVSAAAL